MRRAGAPGREITHAWQLLHAACITLPPQESGCSLHLRRTLLLIGSSLFAARSQGMPLRL